MNLNAHKMETKQSISSKLANITIATGLAIIITLINGAILNKVYPLWGYHINNSTSSWEVLVSGLIFAPLLEEVMYRLVPFKILQNTQIFKENTWWFVILSAIIFGYGHGSILNIYIQGVAGFFFTWAYIKNGMSYWSAVATHFLYNFIYLVIFPTII